MDDDGAGEVRRISLLLMDVLLKEVGDSEVLAIAAVTALVGRVAHGMTHSEDAARTMIEFIANVAIKGLPLLAEDEAETRH